MQEKRVIGQTNETDESLMARYQNGDEQAFEELYRRYSGRVYAY